MLQVLRNQPITVSVTLYNDTGLAVYADAAVTVDITAENGTSIASGATAASGATGVYSYRLEGMANLDVLTFDFHGAVNSETVHYVTQCEIVGGVYATVGEIRNTDTVLLDVGKFPLAAIQDAQRTAEQLFESYCNQSFVARYARTALDGNGGHVMFLPDLRVQRLIDVTEDGVVIDTSSWVVDPDGRMYRPNDVFSPGVPSTAWDALTPPSQRGHGWSNVVVRYEHGTTSVPADIRRAYLKYVRYLLLDKFDRINDRALSMTADGITQQLGVAGPNRPTGFPEIDAVLNNNKAMRATMFGGWGVDY